MQHASTCTCLSRSLQVIRKIIRFTNWMDGKSNVAQLISRNHLLFLSTGKRPEACWDTVRSQKCYMKVKCSLENRDGTESVKKSRTGGVLTIGDWAEQDSKPLSEWNNENDPLRRVKERKREERKGKEQEERERRPLETLMGDQSEVPLWGCQMNCPALKCLLFKQPWNHSGVNECGLIQRHHVNGKLQSIGHQSASNSKKLLEHAH